MTKLGVLRQGKMDTLRIERGGLYAGAHKEKYISGRELNCVANPIHTCLTVL